MAIRWKESYSCNVTEIDNQHKKLFEIGDELYSLINLNDGIDRYDEIIAIVEKLKDYAIYHFQYEEKLLKEYGFNKLGDHSKQHDKFVKKIIELEHKDIDDGQKQITVDMVLFIADWIENHILGTDMQYKDFLNEKGVY